MVVISIPSVCDPGMAPEGVALQGNRKGDPGLPGADRGRTGRLAAHARALSPSPAGDLWSCLARWPEHVPRAGPGRHPWARVLRRFVFPGHRRPGGCGFGLDGGQLAGAGREAPQPPPGDENKQLMPDQCMV